MSAPANQGWHELQAAGIEARRERLRVRPRDFDRWRREGLIAEALRPLCKLAEQELEELVSDAGGPDEITASRRMLLEDAVVLGVMVRAETQRFLATHDPTATERLATWINSRRANLVAAGLERQAKDVTPSLDEHVQELLRSKTDPESTNSDGRGSEVVIEGEVAASEEEA